MHTFPTFCFHQIKTNQCEIITLLICHHYGRNNILGENWARKEIKVKREERLMKNATCGEDGRKGRGNRSENEDKRQTSLVFPQTKIL